MWKHFIPLSFRISREQQSRIENFINVGDAFIQNLTKFSRQEKYFKNNLDLFLSKQREREKNKKRAREKLEKLHAEEKKREQEECEKNEKKKRDEEEKVKEENLRKAKEEQKW